MNYQQLNNKDNPANNPEDIIVDVKCADIFISL